MTDQLVGVRVLRVCLVSDDVTFIGPTSIAIRAVDVHVHSATLGGLLSRPSGMFDLVILDLPPNDQAATDAVVRVREHMHAPVIAVAHRTQESSLVAPLAAGARGLALHTSGRSAIVAAIHAVRDGGVYVDPAVGATLVNLVTLSARAATRTTLTAAELRVLSRFPRGYTNAEIAEDLGLSINTVKTHVRHILSKLACADRVQATRVANERGLLR